MSSKGKVDKSMFIKIKLKTEDNFQDKFNLSQELYDEFSELIKMDNVKLLKIKLESCGIKILDFLEIKLITLRDSQCKDIYILNLNKNILIYAKTYLNKPICLAGLHGSINILQFLIPSATSDQIHHLFTTFVLGSYLGAIKTKRETKLITMLLKMSKSYGHVIIQELLTNDNFYSLRPMELAILLSRFNLAYLFIEKCAFYKRDVASFGMLKVSEYDFREYSPFDDHSRFFYHPLKLMTLVQNENLANLENSNMTSCELTSCQLWRIVKRNLPIVIFNCLSTFCVLILYLTVLAPSHYKIIYSTIYSNHRINNTTSQHKNNNDVYRLGSTTKYCHEKNLYDSQLNNSLSNSPMAFEKWTRALGLVEIKSNVIIAMFFVLKYLFDCMVMIWAFIKTYRQNCRKLNINDITGTCKNRFMKNHFIIHLKCSILVLLLVILSFTSIENETTGYWFYWRLQIFDFLTILMSGLLIFDFLYQISICPIIGSVIQRLLRSFSVFSGMSLLYFSTLAVFAGLFFNLMPCLKFKQYSRNNDLLSSWIAVFHLNLNIIDFDQEEFERIWLLQVLLVMILPFFVINFIVTVINEEVSLVAKHCDLFSRLYFINYFYTFDALFYFPPVNWIFKYIFKCKPNTLKVLSTDKFKKN